MWPTKGAHQTEMEASALGAGSAGSSPSPAPWLSPSVPVRLRPAPTTPSPPGEDDTRSGGAFLREPAAPLCARAAATHASGALSGAEPHQRRVRHGFPCRPLGSWTRTKCFGRHWCATVWTETPGGGGADHVYVMCVCPYMTTCVQLIKMGWCQRTSPFGWTDQPEKTLRLFPPKAGSRRPQSKKSPNPKARKKIARHACLAPHSFGGRGAQSFPSPLRWMPWIRDTY